ncbi:MAG TPA: hypothetical protein ENL27_02645 [Candidatus Parcubacteria bacterium]|nr:hypothetical protein [Candidatus Parcubacteria bacterium]
MSIEVNCALIKEGSGLIGLSLISEPQTEAEIFCASMPNQLIKNQGSIELTEDGIRFINPRVGEVSFFVSPEDLKALRELFSGERGKIGILRDGFLTPGFKIVLVGKENAGQRIRLRRA